MPASVLSFAESVTGLSRQVTITYHGQGGPGRVELTGAQTYDVDLAMMPSAGLRGLLILVDTVDAAGVAVTTPITVTWTSNSESKSEEVSPGGAFALASPSPVSGITALSIVSTANAVVHVVALG